MPNRQGGKNYKKSKHAEDEPIMYEVLPGQMYGRVLKLLGGCNALIYCNDGRERVCHIRGNMRRKVWIDVGDIVLISLRELDNSGNTSRSEVERGDICAKYDQRVILRLQQKDKSINPRLFTTIEKTDGTGQKPSAIPDGDDGFGFVFDDTDNKVINNDESGTGSEEEDERMPANRLAQRRAMAQADDEVDIDNI